MKFMLDMRDELHIAIKSAAAEEKVSMNELLNHAAEMFIVRRLKQKEKETKNIKTCTTSKSWEE